LTPKVNDRSVPARHIGSTTCSVNWSSIERELNSRGCMVVERLLTSAQCAAISAFYDHDHHFRKTVVMARHNFGRGEYRYFDYPLPQIVQDLREDFYHRLAPIANRWNEALGIEHVYPGQLSAYLASCADFGQCLATPLLLRYSAGDYNCLHQDIYGDQSFPLQLAIQLNDPSTDFSGGEFVLTEQRPRMQSRVEVVQLRQGDAVIFPVQVRPVKGSRGYYRVNMRHGVSLIRSGNRDTLGIIFHDAK